MQILKVIINFKENPENDEEELDPLNPDLTKKVPQRQKYEGEIEALMKEQEDLEELKSKSEFISLRKQEEREMGILFIEVDNSFDIKTCQESSISSKFTDCLNFCHRYNYWKFDEKIFKDINLMHEMFTLIADRIIGEHVHYKVDPPKKDQVAGKTVSFKYESFNFVDNYNYIYGNEGVQLQNFIGDFEN